MKMTNSAKLGFVLILVSFALGIGIFRINTFKSVAPCFNTPACNNAMSGRLKVTRYGFPTTYRQVSNYKPDVSSTFANASVEQQGLSWLYIFTNTVFWLAVLGGGYRVATKFAGNKQNQTTSSHTMSTQATKNKK